MRQNSGPQSAEKHVKEVGPRTRPRFSEESVLAVAHGSEPFPYIKIDLPPTNAVIGGIVAVGLVS